MDLLLFITLPATRNPQLATFGALPVLTERTAKKGEKTRYARNEQNAYLDYRPAGIGQDHSF
jgi:hypothetical protein